MQLRSETVNVLKNFSSINTNLVIRRGNKIETMSPSNDIIAAFEADDEFDTQLSIFNLNEFLGVLGAFEKPELELEDKYVLIRQGRQNVKYVYAEESLLITAPKNQEKIVAALANPSVSFNLSDTTLAKLQKMSGILGAEDLAVIGDGSKITLKVLDKKNPNSNEFELDTEVSTDKVFQVNFKMDKLRILQGSYTIDITKRVSKFTNDGIKLYYYIAVESDSVFNE